MYQQWQKHSHKQQYVLNQPNSSKVVSMKFPSWRGINLLRRWLTLFETYFCKMESMTNKYKISKLLWQSLSESTTPLPVYECKATAMWDFNMILSFISKVLNIYGGKKWPASFPGERSPPKYLDSSSVLGVDITVKCRTNAKLIQMRKFAVHFQKQ